MTPSPNLRALLVLVSLLLLGATGAATQTIVITNDPASQPFFYSMQVSGEAVPLVKVEIRDSVNHPTWNVMTELSGSYTFSGPAPLSIPASLRLTAVDGQVITAHDVVTDIGPSGVFDLGTNFTPPWTDLGNGLAGVAGVPVLAGSGALVGGSTVTLDLNSAAPSTSAYLVIGLSELNAPFRGGVMVPNPDLITTPLPTGLSGAIALPLPWPAGLPSGFAIVFQYWIVDLAGPVGFSASNGLAATAP